MENLNDDEAHTVICRLSHQDPQLRGGCEWWFDWGTEPPLVPCGAAARWQSPPPACDFPHDPALFADWAKCSAHQVDNDFGPEKDVVSLMAWDTPPWKQPRSNRDRWLRKDDESHRRRDRDRRPRRSRTPERRTSSDSKGKASGTCKSKTWSSRSLGERRPVPGTTSTARGSTHVGPRTWLQWMQMHCHMTMLCTCGCRSWS